MFIVYYNSTMLPLNLILCELKCIFRVLQIYIYIYMRKREIYEQKWLDKFEYLFVVIDFLILSCNLVTL